jgi:hypothetical protein
MQIKLRRSSHKEGMLLKTWRYELNAILLPTPEEGRLFDTYGYRAAKLSDLVSHDRESWEWKAFEFISIKDIIKGWDFADDNPSRVLAIEGLLIKACQTVLEKARRADCFNGQERVVEITFDETKLVAVG